MKKRILRIDPEKINNVNEGKKIKIVKEKMMLEMLINKILNPLLEIVYECKDSDFYNYVPGTRENTQAGWILYGKKFREIFKALNENIFLNNEQYTRIKIIIESLFSFVRKFEGADGLPDFFFEANPKLHYYTCAFTIPKADRDLFKEKCIGMPTDEENSVADNYHAQNKKKSDDLNLRYDENDFFIEELAYAVRVLFQAIID